MWLSVCPPPPPRRMVQSRFIHKILAEHKRRGLHSSRSVTRYIPGERTWALLSGKPESYLSLTRTRVVVFVYECVSSRCILTTWRLSWIQCLPPAGQTLLSGHSARRRQMMRLLQPPRQRAMQRYELLLLITYSTRSPGRQAFFS